MTVSRLNDRITRVLAASLGVSIVVAVVLLARPAGGHGGVLPASLRFTASEGGAVALAPLAPEPVLAGSAMRPGSHAAGRLVLRNQTGERLAVRLRANPSSTALDGIARVRISDGDRTIFDSTLQALRQGSEALRLAPGRAAVARVIAWIPAETETGYEGRHVEVGLESVEARAR